MECTTEREGRKEGERERGERGGVTNLKFAAIQSSNHEDSLAVLPDIRSNDRHDHTAAVHELMS